MTRTLELIISPTGQVELVTRGYSGSRCRDASRFLEEALGQTSHERLTAEFYQSASVPLQQQVRP